MSEYKCINCGKIKESDSKCNCPVCGYSMFELPYDRHEQLKKTLLGFISHIELHDVSVNDYFFTREKTKVIEGTEKTLIISKRDEKKRCPDYQKLQKYINKATRTEEYCERLTDSLTKLKEYISTPYSMEYRVSFDGVIDKMKSLDDILAPSLMELSIEFNPGEINFPDKVLTEYSEIPDVDLSMRLGLLIDKLIDLSDKIFDFVKKNNIYGNISDDEIENKFAHSEESSYCNEIESCIKKVDRILKKQYVLDIFDDGTKELQSMIKALWYCIGCILDTPVIKEKYTFVDSYSGETFNEKEFNEYVLRLISSRYEKVNSEVFAYDYFNKYSEDDLFHIYNRFIELDTMGFIGVDKSSLLTVGESEHELNNLIGLNSIKTSIAKIRAYALSNKDSENLNIHMCFYGNPGTGKTEVARIIAGILYENKILPTKKIVEVDRAGLVGQYIGETAQKTQRKIQQALGGVLFVDEAYSLIPKDGWEGDYGHEAVATLLKAMEDHRGEFCVILAGYRNEMRRMIESNPGFKSRIQFELDFPNYSRGELDQITKLMLSNRGYVAGDATMSRILDITDIKRKDQNFANAREIRNILDQVIMCQNMRCIGTEDKEICIADINKYIKDANIRLPEIGEGYEKTVMSGEEELDALIGLDGVKRMVKKIKAYAKRNKDDADFNLHMCFYGNPGTGKTEVARIISRILFDAGVLKEAKLIETDAHGLIGKVVGETGPKTLSKINDAMDGVLFIDEAYDFLSFGSGSSGSANYGEEAIAVLLKEMEDRRGQFCVVLAGYKDEMKAMVSSNPGLESRIQFTLDFPDYSRSELGEIAQKFLKKKKYEIEDFALQKILDITDYYRNLPNFANARTVRNILDQVIMNQNLRTEDSVSNIINIDDVEDYITDENINLDSPIKEKHKIGFC